MFRNLITVILLTTFLLLPAKTVSQKAEPGPYLVRDINTHTSTYNKPLVLMEAGPVSYFFGSGGKDIFGLWKTDGTQAGASFVKALGLGVYNMENSGNLSGMLGGYLFFSASDPKGASAQRGVELWRTDGTSEGTTQVADLVPGEGSSMPNNFVEMDGKLYFVGGWALWRLDSADSLPVHIWGEVVDAGKTIFTRRSPLYVLGSRLFFSTYTIDIGTELWISDGTLEGTHSLIDLNPGPASSNAYPLLAYNDRLYFSADDGSTGSELWVYEAASGNIHLVADINPSGASSPQFLQPVSGAVFFQAFEPEHGRELYRLD